MSTENTLIPPCSEKPELLTVSFESEPKADLGVQLRNVDKVRKEYLIEGFNYI